MDHSRSEDLSAVERLLESGDFEGLLRYLESLHPADVADVLEALDPEVQADILTRLDNDLAAEVLTEIDEASGQTLLRILSADRTERVDALLPSEDREQLHELMEFEEDTAGGIMELENIAIREDASIRDAIELARAGADEIENLQKIYVVGDEGVLLGYIDVLDLLIYPRSTPIRDAMKKNAVVVPVTMDQEEVAALFGKYDEFTLPVEDEAGKLVGRITVDDIIDVIEEEASEDIAHIAGTTEDELGEPSPVKISRTRLPWLITGLAGQLIAALIMSGYEAPLQKWFVLAFFVPLIVGTAGSIGIQAAVVVVREMALGQIDVYHTGRRVWKELQVAMINGAILGSILFVAVYVWQRDIDLSVLLFGTLLIVIVAAAFIGASVPLLLQKWKIDPAIATGPFITVSNDIIGLAIYLSLATIYLSRFRTP